MDYRERGGYLGSCRPATAGQRQAGFTPFNCPTYHQCLLHGREKVLYLKRLVASGLYETEDKIKAIAARIRNLLDS